MRTCGTCGNEYDFSLGECNHSGTGKAKKHFLAIGSTDSKFMVALIDFLNDYPLENPENSIIQDIGTRNPMEMIDELEQYKAEEYNRSVNGE